MDRIDVADLGFEGLVAREWLASNSIGGYASSTLCGLNTRKYHGLLVAAMSPPVRRMVILSHVDETVRTGGSVYSIACNEYPGAIYPHGYKHLCAFNNEPFPRWAYQADGFTIEKSLRLMRGENTVCLSYTLLAGTKPIELELRPQLALRGVHELMYQWNGRLVTETREPGHHRIPATARTPEVFFAHDGQFATESVWHLNTIYRREQERGYAGLEDLWVPGTVRWMLSPGQTAHFVCSTDPVDLNQVISEAARPPTAMVVSGYEADATMDDLVRATNVFVVSAGESSGESSGGVPISVMTHLPWSTPSGRGAMISFAGLFMVPGRFEEGRRLLEQYVGLLDGGLLPSEFPEAGGTPVYGGADVSLWFANAVHQYMQYTGDEAAGATLCDALETIIHAYREGTRLGIKADENGLVCTHEPGKPTTWMDAKATDWVVTRRQGRPVELNALWYNALRIVAELSAPLGRQHRADELAAMAEKVKVSFNARFWNADRGCCFDVVEDHGVDPSVRCNQLFAVSLPYAVLVSDRHEQVLWTVTMELLTPFGMRTLSPRDPAYQGRYGGNVIARDRAYHQGSAYPWLLGPLVTAYLRVNGRTEKSMEQARQFIEPCLQYLRSDGVGTIRELFDGNAPHHPGGAIASAPAVAEILRCYSEDILGRAPAATPRSRVAVPSLATQAVRWIPS